MLKLDGGVLGISDSVVYFASNPAIDSSELALVTKNDKDKLGDDGLLIEKDEIIGLHAYQNEKRKTVIISGGTEDSIVVYAGDADTQNKIMDMIIEITGGDIKILLPPN